MYKRGDIVYILENNMDVRQAKVINKSGGFYTIQLVGSCGAIRLKESRLFDSEDAALKSKKWYVLPEENPIYVDPYEGKRTNKSPYDWETGRKR